MRSFFLAVISALFLPTSTLVAEPLVRSHDAGESAVCSTDEDRESGEFWGFNPVDAYKFGLQIQQYVEREDLQSLFGLINGELMNGPRKKLIQGKSFSEMFSKEWRAKVLSQKPNCGPVGWRGFMLGNGNIWYQKDGNGGFELFSINGEAIFELPSPPWEDSGELLLPACFTTPVDAEKYYERFAKRTRRDVSNFTENIGRRFGVEIPRDPSMVKLSECLQTEDQPKAKITDDWVIRDLYSYRVLKRLPLSQCKLLMLNFFGTCSDLRLVRIRWETGGSIGYQYWVTIFGIVEDPIDSEVSYVVPLVNLGGVNNALNFVDELDQ